MDFWVGSALLIVLALFEVVLFGWVLGAEKGLRETNRDSDIQVPKIFRIRDPLHLPGVLSDHPRSICLPELPRKSPCNRCRPRSSFLLSVIWQQCFVLFAGLVHLAWRRWAAAARKD